MKGAEGPAKGLRRHYENALRLRHGDCSRVPLALDLYGLLPGSKAQVLAPHKLIEVGEVVELKQHCLVMAVRRRVAVLIALHRHAAQSAPNNWVEERFYFIVRAIVRQ
jgi:hypothetical protein